MSTQDRMRDDWWHVSAWLLGSEASHGCAGFARRSARKLQRSFGGTHAILEPWGGHDRSAAERSQDPSYGCGSTLGLNKLQNRSMAFALAPHAKYDPQFAATVPVVQEYATQLWDGRINPGLLVRAHKAWVDRRSSKPSWNVLLHCHGRPSMSQSDDGAEPPDRPVVLFLRYWARYSLLISSTHAQGCFPLPLIVSTHRFFPKRGLHGNLMKPTRPCFGPLGFQAYLNLRYSCAGDCKLGAAG